MICHLPGHKYLNTVLLLLLLYALQTASSVGRGYHDASASIIDEVAYSGSGTPPSGASPGASSIPEEGEAPRPKQPAITAAVTSARPGFPAVPARQQHREVEAVERASTDSLDAAQQQLLQLQQQVEEKRREVGRESFPDAWFAAPFRLLAYSVGCAGQALSLHRMTLASPTSCAGMGCASLVLIPCCLPLDTQLPAQAKRIAMEAERVRLQRELDAANADIASANAKLQRATYAPLPEAPTVAVTAAGGRPPLPPGMVARPPAAVSSAAQSRVAALARPAAEVDSGSVVYSEDFDASGAGMSGGLASSGIVEEEQPGSRSGSGGTYSADTGMESVAEEHAYGGASSVSRAGGRSMAQSEIAEEEEESDEVRTAAQLPVTNTNVASEHLVLNIPLAKHRP